MMRRLRLFLIAISAIVPLLGQSSPDQLLLKNFRPKSAYNTPETRVEKARYPVIDMHSHPYAKGADQIAGWVRTMDAKGIDKTVVQTYATGARFDSIAALYQVHGDRFILFCGFDYRGYDQPGFGPAAVKELERCCGKGARGVGELGDKGKGLFYGETKAWGMHIDDPRMDPLLAKCAELNMPVSIHVAEPIWMYLPMDSTNDGLMNAFDWRLDNDPENLGHAATVQTLAKALKRHPQTTFIACHFANCGYDLSILGGMMDTYPNLYADIGARYAEVAPVPRRTARFFQQYADRLVYGTDMGTDARMYEITFRILESADEHFYETAQFGYHWALHGLALEEAVLRKIYRDNALKLMGL